MKYSISGIIIGLVSLLSSVSAGEWIRINQLGYLPESPKVAVFMSEGKAAVEEYVLVEVFTGEIVKRFDNPKKANTPYGFVDQEVCFLIRNNKPMNVNRAFNISNS